jgi:mannose-6-phosphate isomerase-like protein (cupin superfamily)
MTDERYAIHLQPLFGFAERFDAQKLIDETTDPWYNQTLIQLGGVVLRLGVMIGEFHWHSHEAEDELFFLLEGKFHIEIENSPTVRLSPRQGFVVPAGVRHRPVVPVRSAVLMLEQASVIPTGS